MKITLLGSKDFDSLEYHLNDSLLFLEHDVYHIDIKDVVPVSYKYNYWATKLFKKYDEYLFKTIAKRIIESNPDLVICTYRFIHPICIKILKKQIPKVKVIHVNPDAITTFEAQQIFASPYDAYFTKDPFIVEFMKNKMDLNTFYLPEALNPRVHKMPNEDRDELEKQLGIEVLTFGTMYPYRTNMIANLIDSGINVSLYGTMNSRFLRPDLKAKFNSEFITGNRKAELIFGSKIVFNNFHYAEIESANVKFFEIFGIGGFQICDYKPTLEEYSIIPVEQFTFKNIDEAIDLVNYYKDKPELRHQISSKQHEHFIKNHTYEHRVNEILKTL